MCEESSLKVACSGKDCLFSEKVSVLDSEDKLKNIMCKICGEVGSLKADEQLFYLNRALIASGNTSETLRKGAECLTKEKVELFVDCQSCGFSETVRADRWIKFPMNGEEKRACPECGKHELMIVPIHDDEENVVTVCKEDEAGEEWE